jgi:hypothetical protein
MIDKTAMPWSGPLSIKGSSSPLTVSSTGSPFQTLLHQEMGGSNLLDQIFLNYLIKTIQSLMISPTRSASFSSFPNLPVSLKSDLPEDSLPEPESIPEQAAQPEPASPAPAAPKKLTNQKIDDAVREAAEQYGVDPSLIKAVIAVESNGNPRAVSPAGAQGLMQLMPKTAADLGVTDPFEPAQNIKAGTRYLKQLLDRYQGDRNLALAAYNWGMGNLERNPQGLPRETRNYMVRVEKQYQNFLNSPTLA